MYLSCYEKHQSNICSFPEFRPFAYSLFLDIQSKDSAQGHFELSSALNNCSIVIKAVTQQQCLTDIWTQIVLHQLLKIVNMSNIHTPLTSAPKQRGEVSITCLALLFSLTAEFTGFQ